MLIVAHVDHMFQAHYFVISEHFNFLAENYSSTLCVAKNFVRATKTQIRVRVIHKFSKLLPTLAHGEGRKRKRERISRIAYGVRNGRLSILISILPPSFVPIRRRISRHCDAHQLEILSPMRQCYQMDYDSGGLKATVFFPLRSHCRFRSLTGPLFFSRKVFGWMENLTRRMPFMQAQMKSTFDLKWCGQDFWLQLQEAVRNVFRKESIIAPISPS